MRSRENGHQRLRSRACDSAKDSSGGRVMATDGFALRSCECVCAKGETVEPEGAGQQSQAAHAERSSRGFKQAPACNMDETGVPCRTVRGPRACLDSLPPCVYNRVYPAGHFSQVGLFPCSTLDCITGQPLYL